MTPRKAAIPQDDSGHRRIERLKDEVYRQMFRLEACYPGAEMGLALALLRAWIDIDSRLRDNGEREWVAKVSPICLVMIETSLYAASASKSCPL